MDINVNDNGSGIRLHTLQWALTGRCNYNCAHCYVCAPGVRSDEMDTEAMLNLVERISQAGIRRVSLTGGEPLLRGDFLKIAEKLSREGIEITQIATNGSLISHELLRALADMGQRPKISISYDGDDGAHDALRRVSGAGDAALRAFDLCRDAEFKTASEMTLHRDNAHLLRSSIHTLHMHGCTSVKVLPLFPVGEALLTNAPKTLSVKELYRIFTEYISDYYADGMPMELFLYGFFYSRPELDGWALPMARLAASKDPLECILCAHDLSAPYLSADGRLFPCAGMAGFLMYEKEFPRVSDIGFAEALVSDAFCAFSRYSVGEHLRKNARCAACEARFVCGGGCRLVPLSEGNGFHGCDSYCCEFFEGHWQTKIRTAVRKGQLEQLLRRKGENV